MRGIISLKEPFFSYSPVIAGADARIRFLWGG
jgi:hypothetical protein